MAFAPQNLRSYIQPTILLAAALLAASLRADPLHNPPLVCTASQQCSACPTPDGKPLRRVWARGVATDYAYDETGTLSSIAYSDDTPSVAYARDRLGRVVHAVVEGVSTNEYAYSLSGLLTNEVQNGVVLSRTYDDFSRATGYVLHDGLLGA